MTKIVLQALFYDKARIARSRPQLERVFWKELMVPALIPGMVLYQIKVGDTSLTFKVRDPALEHPTVGGGLVWKEGDEAIWVEPEEVFSLDKNGDRELLEEFLKDPTWQQKR